MSDESKASRGLTRLILFEGLAVAGLLHLLLYAPASDRYTLYFLYNGLAFLAVYPAVYFFKWIPLPGFFRFLLFPLNILLHSAMLISTFVWLGYVVFVRWHPYFPVLIDNILVLWVFWAVLYLAWFRYVLGASQQYVTLGPMLALTMIVAAGGLAGFFLGRWVVGRWGEHVGSDSMRFLLWVLLVLVCAAGAGFMAPKKSESQG